MNFTLYKIFLATVYVQIILIINFLLYTEQARLIFHNWNSWINEITNTFITLSKLMCIIIITKLIIMKCCSR